jgi:predicted enzyme related to lactoylglutathione lyase
MVIARYKDLCIDSSPGPTLGRFWAKALGLQFEPDESPDEAGSLTGADPTQRVWMNVVPEAKSAKHRVHIDVHCASIDELVALGAAVLEPQTEDRGWTVMTDPEGGEFCAFVRSADTLPDYRLYELVVDCVEPRRVAAWWADVLGAKLGGDEGHDWWWLEDIPGVPFEGWAFVPVPEPKTVKNRVHWDVLVDSVDDLVAAGATLLRGPAPDGNWSIMADPEGNEFCAFVARG